MMQLKLLLDTAQMEPASWMCEYEASRYRDLVADYRTQLIKAMTSRN